MSRVAPPTAVPGTVVPERLIRLLDATPADRPSLVLVTAPPGYGKTTLVAEWCARQEEPPVWCSPAGTEHTSDDLGDLVGHALGADRDPPPLVLDDLHHLDDEARTGLDRFLATLTAPVRVVLVSRGDPLLPVLLRHRLAGTLTEVRAADLALTLDEAAEARPDLAADLLTSVWAACEGWPAVVRLRGTIPDTAIEDCLFGEVWGSLSGPTRRLLMLAAVPDPIPLDLAVDLTGRTDAGDVLDRFGRTTGLVSRVPGHAPDLPATYRFQPVLRAYLRQQLDLHDRHAAVRAHAASADHVLRSGRGLSAIEHAVGSADAVLLDDVVAACGAGLVASGESESVLGLLQRATQHSGQGAAGWTAPGHPGPWVYGLAAAAELDVGRVAVADSHLATARALAGEPRGSGAPVRPLDVLLQAAQTHLRRRRGEATPVSHLMADPPTSIGPDLRLLLAVQRGQALVWRGEWDAAERELTTGAELARGLERDAALVECLAGLAAVEASRSSVTGTRQHAEEALRVAQARGWAQTPRVAFAHVLASWAAWQQLQPVQARSHMDAALAVLDPEADPSIVVAARALQAGLAHAEEGTPESAERLHALWSVLGRGEAAPSLVAYAVLADLRSSLAVRRTGWARDVAELARARMASLGEVRVVDAMVADSAGQPARARELVTAVASGRVPTALPSTRVEALGLRARIAICAGDLRAAREDARSALALAAELGCLRTVAEAGGPELLDLLQAERSRWGEHEDVVGALVERGREPAPPTTAALTAREAEVLRELPSLRTVEEIAEVLCLSPNTVKTHVSSVYRKLGVATRRDAISEARRTGLL